MDNLIEEMHDFLKEIYPLLEGKSESTTTPLQGTEEKQVIVEALWKGLKNLQKLESFMW